MTSKENIMFLSFPLSSFLSQKNLIIAIHTEELEIAKLNLYLWQKKIKAIFNFIPKFASMCTLNKKLTERSWKNIFLDSGGAF